MAKNTFLSFDTTASNNTDIAGIDIQGTAAVMNFDNAFRQLMAILRTDLDNGQVFVTKAAGYTALAADNNAFYEFTASATLALTAAATLAADWHMIVFANGGAVTIDPDGAELINGAATLVVADGDAAYIICTGTAFKAITIPSVAGVAKLATENTFTKTQIWAKGADVASATALALGDDGNYFDVTGTTAITSIGTVGVGAVIKLHFDGILTLTHNATDLVLPGGANITTAAGDEAEFVEYAAGDWRCVGYQRASGQAVAQLGSGSITTTTLATTALVTGILSDAKQIMCVVTGLQTTGTSTIIFQLGTGGTLTTSGYSGSGSRLAAAAAATVSVTSGLVIYANSNTEIISGVVTATIVDAATNQWVLNFYGSHGTTLTLLSSSVVSLAGVADRIAFVANSGNLVAGGKINMRQSQ